MPNANPTSNANAPTITNPPTVNLVVLAGPGGLYAPPGAPFDKMKVDYGRLILPPPGIGRKFEGEWTIAVSRIELIQGFVDSNKDIKGKWVGGKDAVIAMWNQDYGWFQTYKNVVSLTARLQHDKLALRKMAVAAGVAIPLLP